MVSAIRRITAIGRIPLRSRDRLHSAQPANAGISNASNPQHAGMNLQVEAIHQPQLLELLFGKFDGGSGREPSCRRKRHIFTWIPCSFSSAQQQGGVPGFPEVPGLQPGPGNYARDAPIRLVIAMFNSDALRAKLAKVEELFRRAGNPGERAAAEAAMERLHGRLKGTQGDREPEVELKMSLSDMWSVRLFVAICRKHGVRPFRYARQRRTTVMVRVRERFFDRVIWPEFSQLHTELENYFEDVTDHLITRAMQSDGDDSALDR